MVPTPLLRPRQDVRVSVLHNLLFRLGLLWYCYSYPAAVGRLLPVFTMPCDFNSRALWSSISSTHLCVFFQREPFAFGAEIPRDYSQFSEAQVGSAKAGLLSLTLVWEEIVSSPASSSSSWEPLWLVGLHQQSVTFQPSASLSPPGCCPCFSWFFSRSFILNFFFFLVVKDSKELQLPTGAHPVYNTVGEKASVWVCIWPFLEG